MKSFPLFIKQIYIKIIRLYRLVLSHRKVYSENPYIQNKRNQMVRTIAWMCVFPTLYFALVNLEDQRFLLASINILNSLSSATVLVLLHYRRIESAKAVLLGFNFIFFLAGAILFKNGAEYFLISILVASMMLYDQRKVHIFFGAMVAVSMVAIFILGERVNITEPLPKARVLVNMISSIGFIILVTNSFLQIIKNNLLKIQKQKRALKESNQEKEKVFSIIAHDVKSPLASLENLVLALKHHIFNQEKSIEFISDIHAHILKQNQILDDLLKWGSSNVKGATGEKTKVCLLPVVNDTINNFQEQIKRKSLHVSLEISPEDSVVADMEHIRIIIRNILSNAIKFSFFGGKIKLSVKVEGTRTYISIIDHGIGISMKDLSTLFKSVQRNSLGTADERGSGIGLLLIKDLIERNHGTVEVQSKPAEGTVLRVGFPNVPQIGKT